jgi:DNA-binding transcriptional MerR regulator
MAFDFKVWWQDNGEAVRKRRRSRYHSDKAFKKRQKKWSKDYRQKQQEQLGKREPEVRAHRRPIVIEVEGQKFVCWSVGVLASTIDRGRRTIDTWEKKGLIPRTPIWWSGIRYYTEGMIEGLADVLATREGGLRVSDPLVFYEVLSKWEGAGLELFREGDYLVTELTEVPLWGDLPPILTVDAFAERVGKSKGTLLHWERIGLIPATPLRYGEDRVFTEGMCEVVERAIEVRGDVVRISDGPLVQEIRDGWVLELKALGCAKNIKTGETVDVREIANDT